MHLYHIYSNMAKISDEQHDSRCKCNVKEIVDGPIVIKVLNERLQIYFWA